MDGFVELGVQAHLIDPEAAKRDAEDLAWDHAKMAASVSGIALGGEAFEFLYKELDARYSDMADHLEYLTFNALVLLRNMLNTGLLELGTATPATEADVADTLGKISQTIVSSYAMIIAGQALLWPRNGTLADSSVTFRFLSEDITLEQE